MTYTDELKSAGDAAVDYLNRVLFIAGLLVFVIGIVAKTFFLITVGLIGMGLVKACKKDEAFDGTIEGSVKTIKPLSLK